MTAHTVDMAEVVERLVAPLLSQPDDLTITSRMRETTAILTLRVSPEDGGRLIGRGGETIRSIRTIVEYAARRVGASVQIELQDA
ncbi:MAG: KH domain-containing protein [Myxococcales bacterium]|nr:KH domain-containing protein [Myxococcales bacterium]